MMLWNIQRFVGSKIYLVIKYCQWCDLEKMGSVHWGLPTSVAINDKNKTTTHNQEGKFADHYYLYFFHLILKLNKW